MKLILLAIIFSIASIMSASGAAEKFVKNEFIYEYSFATDGGAVGSVALRNVGINAMPAGCVIEDLQVFVETAFDDAGNTATVILGPTGGDDDGYLVDFMTLAETVNTPVRAGQVAGALLWDNTNDAMLSYYAPSAAYGVPTMKIGTEALTQGKAKFIFVCRRY